MTPAEEDALIATARKRAANEGTGIVTRDQVIRLAIRAAVAAERERMCADSLRLDVLEMWWQRRLAGMCVSALDVFAEIEFCFSQDIRSAIDHAVKYGPHPEGEHGLIVDRCAAAIREGEK